MGKGSRLLRLFAGAAALSAALLVLMAMLPFPPGLGYPGLEVLTGELHLLPDAYSGYLSTMRLLFVLDSIFLAGWLVSWVGLGLLLRKRSLPAGTLVLILGAAGVFFDLAENSIIQGVLHQLQQGIDPGTAWVARWQLVQHVSYWLPFLGALLAAFFLWGSRWEEKAVVVAGGMAPLAGICLYLPGLSLLASAWFLPWFLGLALLFRRYDNNSASPPERERKVSMAAAKVRWIRYALYAAVYFVEGAVLTYFTAFNTLYLRSFSLSFSLIGIVGGITLIPFILKILIGLLSDRVSLLGRGHRKPYIILGLGLQTLAFVLIPSVSPVGSFPLFLVLMILASLGMSTYDTTTDGLSIDSTPENERGTVQGIMVGGRALSAVVTAALMGLFSGRGDWASIFYMIAGLGVLALVLAFLVKEDTERPPELAYTGEAFRSFKDRALLLFLVLGVVYPLALYSAQGMVGAYLNEGFGVPLTAVGLYTSVFGVGTILGGVVGGPLMKKIGEKASILAALLLTSAVTFVLAAAPSSGFMWAVVFLFGNAFGYYETVYFAMGMDFSDPRIAAFMFAVIMAVGNFGIAGGQPLAGALVDAAGFRTMFLIFGAVHLLALPAVFGIFRLRRSQTPAAS